MGMLRGAQAIDPASASQRKANLQVGRRREGLTPLEQRTAPTQPTLGQAPSMGVTPEEELAADVTSPGTAIPVVIDALNESIIALKMEIHRTAQTEHKRELEQHAERLRTEILELGGEPIWADETVEEGLRKLQGRGYVAEDRVQDMASQYTDPDFAQRLITDIQRVEGAERTPERQDYFQQWGGIDAYLTSQQQRLEGLAQTPVTETPSMGDPAGSPVDDIMAQLGQGPTPTSAPTPIVTPDYVNQMMQQYGLEPRSSEDIATHASAIVERQAWGKSQVIQRELERFESEFPDEFDRAQQQINEYASEATAGREEEFAARGLYYSSIMATSIGKIDKQAMDAITQIARDAANYVSELHSDLRDIAQWAVLEEEVVRRQLESEDQAFRERLMGLQTQLAIHADQMALDTWYRQESLNLQERGVQLEEIKLQIAEAERQGQHLATAYMSDYPLVQDALSSMGISAAQLNQMPLEARAHLINTVVNFTEIDQRMRLNEVQTEAILADIRLADARFGLDLRKFEEGVNQFWAQFGLQQQELSHVTTIDTQRLELDRIRIAQGWLDYDLQKQQIDHNIQLAEFERQQYESRLGREIATDAYNAYMAGLASLPDNLTDANAALKYLRQTGAWGWAIELSKLIADAEAESQGKAPWWHGLGQKLLGGDGHSGGSTIYTSPGTGETIRPGTYYGR